MTSIVIPDGTQAALQKETGEKRGLYEAVKELSITDEQSYKEAGEILVEIKKQLKALETRRKTVVDPLNGVVKEVRSWFKPAEEYLERCEAHLKQLVGAYQAEVARKNQEALAALSAAAAEQDQVKVAMAVGSIASTPKAQGISVREAWDWELVDENQVPREFLSVDPVKVNAYARAAKDHEPSPVAGIRFFRKQVVTTRVS